MAQTLADQVNAGLNNGIDLNGAAPVTNLFAYNASTGAAATLTVNPLTTDQDYGNLGGQVGTDLSAAQNNSTTDQSLLSQAESLRQQISGVSLDSEAESLLQYNRSYDAISKMLGVLNSLSLDIVNLLPPISSS